LYNCELSGVLTTKRLCCEEWITWQLMLALCCGIRCYGLWCLMLWFRATYYILLRTEVQLQDVQQYARSTYLVSLTKAS
jgi:hypothetical protein